MIPRDSRKVLVVDDDADFCESLTDILRSARYEVMTSSTASDALEEVHRFCPQVCLVDIRLGRDNGMDLVRTLQTAAPGSLCVAMTAYAGPETAVIQALKAGAYDYITKPFEAEDLFATLDRCFERVRLLEEKEAARAALEARNTELSELNEKLRDMVEAAKKLASYREETEFERDLLAVYARILGASGGSFYVLEGQALRKAGWLGPDHAPSVLPLPLRPGCVFDRALRMRQPVLMEDIANAQAVSRSGWTGYRNGSLLVLPVEERRIGFLGLISLHEKEVPPFTRQDLDLCGILASLSLEVINSIRAHAALRENEALYREVFEKTSDGLFVVDVTPDRRYRLVSYNPAQQRMLGISTADAVGKLDYEYLPKNVLDVVREQNAKVIEAGRPMSFESAIELPGGLSHFFTTLVPVRDAQGRIHRLIGLARDMTENKRIEEALRQSEEKFSKAFHGSPDAVAISSLEDGVLLEVNQGFLDVYGYEREEVIGHSSLPKDLGIWVSPEDRDRMLALMREKGEVRGEWRQYRRKDASIGYGLTSWRIIEIDGRKRLLTITRDLTERRLMEDALRDSEGRFRLLAENSTDMISRHTAEGVYLYVSPACAALLGYAPEELVGRSAYDFFHPEDLATIRKSHGTIMERTTAYTVSYRIRRKDGTYTWFETVSRGVRDPRTGQMVEIQAASRDISERVAAQDREREHEQQLFQASKLASLGTLVSGIAHEINNPNNYIRLNSQNLGEFWADIRAILDETAPADGPLRLRGIPYETARGMVEDLLRGIGEGSQRIEKLLRNLRDFARGDEGALDEAVDMNAVVASGVMIVQSLVQKSTDALSIREHPSLARVRGNYHQLEQVVINLVTNACQALPSRDRKITIETRMEDGGKWVVLLVTDEGIGIPPGDMKRLLDPFFTTKREMGGSGLGLPVSARIVENHGGRMSFQSEVGKGTMVTVRLPAGSVR